MQFNPKVDLSFHLLGRTLPVDHGYALYSAVSKILPHFHKDNEAGLKMIRGRYVGDGILDISPSAQLVFRLRASKISEYLELAGKALDVLTNKLTVGVPRTKTLIPSPSLYAPLVTTKNGQDQRRFEVEIQSQMNALEVQGKFDAGKRRTFGVHGKQVVGYSLMITELSPTESIVLQECGLGGRRKMGCGIFEPVESE